MEKIAIVDICGTLFNSNTTLDFLKHNDAAYAKLSRNVFFKIGNKLLIKFFDYDLLRAYGIKKIKGCSRSYLESKARQFYEDFLVPNINLEPMQLVADLKSRGYQIILVSGTMDFIAAEIAARINADEVYSTMLQYNDDGVCQGYIKTELLGSKHIVLADINRKYDNNTSIYTITDNKTDIKLINLSNDKCVVSEARNIQFWKKNLKDEFRLIEI